MLVKMKIVLICVYKEYQVEIKMVQVQWLQPKIKFLVCYNINFWLVREGDSPISRCLENPANMCEV